MNLRPGMPGLQIRKLWQGAYCSNRGVNNFSSAIFYLAVPWFIRIFRKLFAALQAGRQPQDRGRGRYGCVY